MSEVRVKISRKFTLYLPRSITRALDLREGDYVKLRVEGGRVILEPVLDPFDLALRGRKFAKVTFEEFERESEELQRELSS